MPWDVNYASTVNAANTRFSNQKLSFEQQRQLAEQDFGMGQYADAATNPYSRAALLRKSYDTSVRGTRNSAGRQLYSGSYELAQRGNEGDYAKGSDELLRQYRAALSDIGQREAEAREQQERDIEDAGWKRLENAAQEEPEPAPVPAGRRGAGRRKKKIREGVSRARAVR